MKKEIAELWVKALRDGSYEQAAGRLRKVASDQSITRYCCLGVLCDLYLKETDKGEWIGEVFKIDRTDASNVVLPHQVEYWAGMRTRDGSFAARKNLMIMNDSGASFNEIANTIEKYQEKL